MLITFICKNMIFNIAIITRNIFNDSGLIVDTNISI